MNRRLQGFAVVCLAWNLVHPAICSAQLQSLSPEDPSSKMELLEISTGPGAHEFHRIGEPRITDPNDPWSEQAVISLTSISFYRMNDDVRGHLKLPKDRGLIVARVSPKSPEREIGIRENDILLTLGDAPLGSPRDVAERLKAIGDKPAALVLLRNGDTVTIPVQPRVQYGFTAPKVKEVKQVYVIGVTTFPIDPLLHAQLKLPEGRVLSIRHVDDKGPAAKAGIAVGDLLMRLNGEAVKDEHSLHQRIQANGEKPVVLELIHEGNAKTVTLTPVQKKDLSLRIGVASGPQPGYRIVTREGKPALEKTPFTVTFEPNFTMGVATSPPAGRMVTTIPGIAIDPKNVGPNLEPYYKALYAAGKPGGVDPFAKRLDEMSAQIDAIRKAVDDLAKVLKDKK